MRQCRELNEICRTLSSQAPRIRKNSRLNNRLLINRKGESRSGIGRLALDCWNFVDCLVIFRLHDDTRNIRRTRPASPSLPRLYNSVICLSLIELIDLALVRVLNGGEKTASKEL